jgi:hypothetical protein
MRRKPSPTFRQANRVTDSSFSSQPPFASSANKSRRISRQLGGGVRRSQIMGSARPVP